MTINKEAIRAAAMSATQGEWCFGSFHELLVVPVKNGVPDKHDPIASLGETAIPWDSDSYSEERYKNAEHIATSNPATVLSLLDALDKAEKDADYKQSQIDTLMLEYCPNEMTPEQLSRWEECQRPAIEQAKGVGA